MAVKDAVVTVGTTPTALYSAEAQAHEGRKYGRDYGQSVLLTNEGTVDIFIGGPTVSTATGTKLSAGASMPADAVGDDDIFFGIVATGTAPVKVLVIGA